jgi:hypothetical protein
MRFKSGLILDKSGRSGRKVGLVLAGEQRKGKMVRSKRSISSQLGQ